MTSFSTAGLGVALLVGWLAAGCTPPPRWQDQPTPPIHRGDGAHQNAGLLPDEAASQPGLHAPEDHASRTDRPRAKAGRPSLAEVEKAIRSFQRLRQQGDPAADNAWEPFLQTVFDYMDQPLERLSLSPLIRARVAAEFELDTERRRPAGADPELIRLVDDLLTHIDYRVRRIRSLAGTSRVMVHTGRDDRMTWPLAFGLITSEFGMRPDPLCPERDQFHQGIDLAAPPHEPVYAAAAGEVIFVGFNGGYGRMVRIRHPGGIETVYAHLAATLVHWEQQVARGQVLGLLGRSGRTTGHHLHFGVYLEGRAVDPIDHLAEIPMSFSDTTPGTIFGYPGGT